MIKFSYHYRKMPEHYHLSKLLEVLVVPADLLSDTFVEYDATKDNGTLYKLPKRGLVLVLLLQTVDGEQLWTTVRRQTPQKEAYYRGLVGTIQECKVIEES